MIASSVFEYIEWDDLFLTDLPNPDEERPAKKKRIRDRSYAIPRLLKSDLRRQYGFMLINVLNSADNLLIASFFDQFASHCLSLNKRNLCPEDCFFVQMQGSRAVSKYWSLLLELTPDQVFRLLDVQVRTRRGEQGRCRLVAQFTVQGTRIQSLSPEQVAQCILSQLQEDNSGDSGSNSSGVMPFVPVPRDPSEFLFHGQFVLHIGADKRIEKVDIETQ